MQKIFEYDLIFLLKKIPYLWFFSTLNGLTNFILFVILARYLSIDNYGLFYSSFILLSFFSSFTGFGLDTLILKLFGKYKKELLKFRKNFIFYFIFTSVISIIFYLITILLLKNTFNFIYSLSLMPLIFNLFLINLVNIKLQLEKKFIYLSILNFLHNFLRFIILLLFYYYSAITIQNAILIFIISSCVMIIICVYEIYKFDINQIIEKNSFLENNKSEEVHNSINNIIYISKKSLPYGLAGLIFLIYYQIDIIFLKILKNDLSVSLYSCCFIILGAVYIFPFALTSKILTPSIHKYADKKELLIKNLKFLLPIFFISGLFVQLIIYLFSDFLINLLFNENYYGAIFLLKVLSFAIPLRFLISILGSFLEINDLINNKVKYMFCAASINIVLNLILIPSYDIIGAAISTIITEIILLAMYFYLIKKELIDK